MQERSIENIDLHGGWLCLDFINTVHNRSIPDSYDYLSSYGEVLNWTSRLQTLPVESIAVLTRKYALHNQHAESVLKKFIEAREVLYNLFNAIIHNSYPAKDTQENFNRLLSLSLAKLKINLESVQSPSHYWEGDDLEKPLYPIVKSAYDLLTSDKLNRVKECGACGWVFLDKSKNNSRRWCDMQACGSSAKARRYYKKKKQENKS